MPNLTAKTLLISVGHLLGYWPLSEPSGAVAADQSGNSYDGAVTGATFGVTGIGDGHTASGLRRQRGLRRHLLRGVGGRV